MQYCLLNRSHKNIQKKSNWIHMDIESKFEDFQNSEVPINLSRRYICFGEFCGCQ